MKHILRKWDYKTRSYKPYEVDPNWKLVPLIQDDISEIYNCAQCGTERTFGEMYTSKEVHTSAGFGYCVCEDCAEEEQIRYANSRVDDRKKHNDNLQS